MADAVVNIPPSRRSHVQTQHLAWGVMLLAFALFCVICLASGLGVHYFLFQSTVPMETVLTVGRSTALVTRPDGSTTQERVSSPLASRSSVNTDSAGQANLTFYDESVDDPRVIATVTMNSDTSLNLQEVSRPRFNWSTTVHIIHLTDISGVLELVIPEDSNPQVEMRITTAQGVTVDLMESGRYSITANNAQVFVETISGRAELVAGEYNDVLNDGERVMYNVTAHELALLFPYVRLLGTSGFDETNIFASAPPQDVSAWGCSNPANDDVKGSFSLAIENGQPMLHFTRAGSNQHGESGCFTSRGGSGIDVTGYEYLSLDVTFKLISQSVSGCGDAGSECPLMLELHYIAADGSSRLWHHGFYLWNSDPNNPRSCSTCPQEHEMINGNVMYRYRSDNLISSFAPEQRPVRILTMRIYASGHEYDVYVSEASLLAIEELEAIPVG